MKTPLRVFEEISSKKDPFFDNCNAMLRELRSKIDARLLCKPGTKEKNHYS